MFQLCCGEVGSGRCHGFMRVTYRERERERATNLIDEEEKISLSARLSLIM